MHMQCDNVNGGDVEGRIRVASRSERRTCRKSIVTNTAANTCTPIDYLHNSKCTQRTIVRA